MHELIDFLRKEDVKHFIKANVTVDVNRLILNPPSNFKERIKDIASQILARQKAKGKLNDWAVNFDLIMPPPLSIEQASSQATCEYKSKLVSGSHLIDLTGGMGIDFLSISESFQESSYVEQSSLLCSIFQHNADVLGNNANVFNEEASHYLGNLISSEKPVIYLDPARRDDQKGKVFKVEDCSPNLTDLFPLLKEKASQVLVKYSPFLDFHSVLTQIPGIKEIHIVSVKNETKELLFLIDFEFQGEPTIHCINLGSDHTPFSFKLDDEKTTEVSLDHVSEYLYEPNSSIMKGGAFKRIALDFNVNKLAEHTHLYTSSKTIEDFPGRIFKVIAEATKKNIQQYALNGKINVITRNYSLSASELKKKWKLKDGGNYFLVGFRDKDDKPKMVIAERLGPVK